jgi:hypothetical protein
VQGVEVFCGLFDPQLGVVVGADGCAARVPADVAVPHDVELGPVEGAAVLGEARCAGGERERLGAGPVDGERVPAVDAGGDDRRQAGARGAAEGADAARPRPAGGRVVADDVEPAPPGGAVDLGARGGVVWVERGAAIWNVVVADAGRLAPRPIVENEAMALRRMGPVIPASGSRVRGSITGP